MITPSLLVIFLSPLPASPQAKPVTKEFPFVVVEGKPTADPPRAKLPPNAPAAFEQAGLRWLKRAQHASGCWQRRKRADVDADLIPTALAVQAFLNAGHTHRYGTYKLTVSKGLRWLKAYQSPDGRWGSKHCRTPVITHALACMTLAEAYFITRDPFLKRYVQRGYHALLDLEAPRGGWGFKRGSTPNALATAIAVLALKTIKLTDRITVDPTAFERARDRLKACTGPRGLVGFRAPGNGISLRPVVRYYGVRSSKPRVPLFTAGAVIGRIFCGERRTVDGIRRGHRRLTLPHPVRVEPLYTYLGTYAVFQFGGPRWNAWIPSLRATLARTRKPDGSWPPTGIVGRLGGASGTTALNLMSYEIVRRYQRAMRD